MQLASLHMELQDLKNGKEVKTETHYEVWWTKCKVEGHHKDQCHIFQDYIGAGGPNPLKPSFTGSNIGASTRCSIFQISGQDSTDNFSLLQKFMQYPK